MDLSTKKMTGNKPLFIKVSLIFAFIQLLFMVNNYAQRLSFGVTYQMTGLHYTHFTKDVYFSPSSFKGYYLDKNQFSFTGACMNVGFVALMDISRFSLWMEWSIFSDIEGQVTKLKYPWADDTFHIYYSRINNGGSRMLAEIQYVLSPSRSMKPFAGFGFANLSPIQATEDISTKRNFSKGWFDEYEMRPVFNFDKNYNLFLLETGIKNSYLAFSVRYFFKWNRLTPNDNFYSFFTLSLSAITNFSGLKRQMLYFE